MCDSSSIHLYVISIPYRFAWRCTEMFQYGRVCLKAAAEEACQGTGEAEHWKELPGQLTLCGLMLSCCYRARSLQMKLQDLLQLWDRLGQDLEEARAAMLGMANAYIY